MYRVVYYRNNRRDSKIFDTLTEAFNFWGRLPFESFSELYKIES